MEPILIDLAFRRGHSEREAVDDERYASTGQGHNQGCLPGTQQPAEASAEAAEQRAAHHRRGDEGRRGQPVALFASPLTERSDA